MEDVGKIIVGTGIVLVIVGLFVCLFADIGWFGNLPGDIKIEHPGFGLYIPITTMLLIGFGLSFVMWLINSFAKVRFIYTSLDFSHASEYQDRHQAIAVVPPTF